MNDSRGDSNQQIGDCMRQQVVSVSAPTPLKEAARVVVEKREGEISD